MLVRLNRRKPSTVILKYFAEWHWYDRRNRMNHDEEFSFEFECDYESANPVALAEKQARKMIRKMRRNGELRKLYRVQRGSEIHAPQDRTKAFLPEYRFTLVRDCYIETYLVLYQLPRDFIAGIYLSKEEARKHPKWRSVKHATTILERISIDDIGKYAALLPWHRKRIAQLREEANKVNINNP